jgi:hypothetical protein
VIATPKDNLEMAKRMLDENQDLAAINKVHYLLATAYDKQHLGFRPKSSCLEHVQGDYYNQAGSQG